MKIATFTATVQIEISAPADCSANQIGDLIDACVWDLGYEAPGVSVREVLVLCNQDEQPRYEILDDAPTSAQ